MKSAGQGNNITFFKRYQRLEEQIIWEDELKVGVDLRSLGDVGIKIAQKSAFLGY